MTGNVPEQQHLPSLIDEPWLRSQDTQAILAIIEQGGFEARVVGGAIRNSLLGRPVKDIDIATTAAPAETQDLAKQNGLKAIATGIAHGTVTVICGDTAYEVTTLRKDVSTDGRHAVVAFTNNWVEDARRRDFTMNAMYCDRNGSIFDPMNGYSDLLARQVRFVGVARQRIEEDYLRSLRFFRFFAEYGQGAPDPVALEDIVNCRVGLQRLSGERIRQEFLKILIAPGAVEIIQVMHEHGLLPYVLPVVPRLNHFARLCGSQPESSAIVRLAILSVGCREDGERISRKMRLSNAEAEILAFIAAIHPSLGASPDLTLGRRWYYNEGRELFQARIRASQSSSYRQLADPAWISLHDLLETWQPPAFPLSGRDAIALGANPGPEIGHHLADVRRQWIESDFALSQTDLIAILTANLKRK